MTITGQRLREMYNYLVRSPGVGHNRAQVSVDKIQASEDPEGEFLTQQQLLDKYAEADAKRRETKEAKRKSSPEYMAWEQGRAQRAEQRRVADAEHAAALQKAVQELEEASRVAALDQAVRAVLAELCVTDLGQPGYLMSERPQRLAKLRELQAQLPPGHVLRPGT